MQLKQLKHETKSLSWILKIMKTVARV